jgi:hypothetical protein
MAWFEVIAPLLDDGWRSAGAHGPRHVLGVGPQHLAGGRHEEVGGGEEGGVPGVGRRGGEGAGRPLGAASELVEGHVRHRCILRTGVGGAVGRRADSRVVDEPRRCRPARPGVRRS